MCREDLGGSSQIKPAKKMTPVFGTEGQEFQTAEGIFVSFPVTSEHGFPGSFTEPCRAGSMRLFVQCVFSVGLALIIMLAEKMDTWVHVSLNM